MKVFSVLLVVLLSFPAWAAKPAPVGAAKGVKDAPFAFEAERVAIAKGCARADGVRPTALMTEKRGLVEVYEVACQAGRMVVRCEPGNCRVVEGG